MTSAPSHIPPLRTLLPRVLLALAVSAAVLVITQEDILKLGIIQRLELASIDYRFDARGRDPALKDSSTVVIVEMSSASHTSLPGQYPWPRSYYARLIRNLRAAGARAVGLDVIFTGRDVYSAANDSDLAAAIRNAGNVALAGKVEPVPAQYRIRTKLEDFGNLFFRVDSSLGLVNVVNDADGVLRRYNAFFDSEAGFPVPTFAFAVLNKYFNRPALTTAENFPDGFLYGRQEIPKYDNASFLINFQGPSGAFPRFNIADVLDDSTFTTTEEQETGVQINSFSDPEFGYLHDGSFRDKIVLVGSTVPEDHDLFPVARGGGRGGGDNLMYGVEIHANVIESFLRGAFIRKESPLLEVLSVIFFTCLTFFVTSALKGSRTRHAVLVEFNGVLFGLAEIFVIGYAALLLFNEYNYLMTVISPMIAVAGGYSASTAYHFVIERKQRLAIKAIFGTYLNPAVVEELVSNPDRFRLGGEKRTLSVLFGDIEGFTTISEQVPPEELVSLLNEYLSAMADEIFLTDGTLDKYMGDAVMAFWGAPVPLPDHALRACRTALAMQETARRMEAAWSALGRPVFNIRVGINTGEMIVGKMGGVKKVDYTVIGDSVNLASRLEGANKQYHTRVIASGETYALVEAAILGRPLDHIAVKGRSEPVVIYELLHERSRPMLLEDTEFLNHYNEGMRLYKDRAWTESLLAFQKAHALRPDDVPTQLYISRTRTYESDPPPSDWNGVFVMTVK